MKRKSSERQVFSCCRLKRTEETIVLSLELQTNNWKCFYALDHKIFFVHSVPQIAEKYLQTMNKQKV